MSYTFKVTLTDQYGNPVYNRSVDIIIDNNYYTTVQTAMDGTATFMVNLSPGTHTIEVNFGGDVIFVGSSASLTINVPQATYTQSQVTCKPTPSTGNNILDTVVFCVGNYGITVLDIGLIILMLFILMR